MRNRIKIFSAGIFMNLAIFSLDMIIYSFTRNTIFILCALPNLFQIVTNLSPFMPLDGYLMLSTILKFPNMRKNFFKLVKNMFKKSSIFKDKKNIFLVVYLFFSLTLMFFAVTSQVSWVARELSTYYSSDLSLLEFLWRIKVMLVFIAIVFMKFIYNIYIKVHNNTKLNYKNNIQN